MNTSVHLFNIYKEIFSLGPAVKFSESVNEGIAPPPVLGEHTDVILSNILSYSIDNIIALKKDEVIL